MYRLLNNINPLHDMQQKCEALYTKCMCWDRSVFLGDYICRIDKKQFPLQDCEEIVEDT